MRRTSWYGRRTARSTSAIFRPDAKPGTKDPYLTVATYPFQGAYPAIQAVTKNGNITKIKLSKQGLAETEKGPSTNVHAAYPDVDYQVEVYDPAPGAAAALVSAGKLAALGNLTSGSTSTPAPKAMTPTELKSLAASLGHPVYWAGTKAGTTYEVGTSSNGQVSVRYLPQGTKVGAQGEYLTVGTYPYPGAFEAIKALTTSPNIVTIKLPGGGLAVLDKTGPRKNIHLAYPGSDYQIEVFDPSARTARQVVATGKVKSIG